MFKYSYYFYIYFLYINNKVKIFKAASLSSMPLAIDSSGTCVLKKFLSLISCNVF